MRGSCHYPFLTAYERDNETGLDFAQARYYANAQGRFTSVDPLMASGHVAMPQSWNRYTYALNNPLRFTDSDGREPGDYYNQDGKRLGTDGIDDKKIYVVTDKDQAKQIEQANKKGGTTALSAVSSAVELPNYDVRQAIGEAVDRSNGKTADDTQGGFHEEGLQWGKTADGQERIVNAAPGEYADLKTATVATIVTSNAANPAEQGIITNLEGTSHVHPKGEITISPSNNSPGIVVGGTTTTKNFVQPPSAVDISNARAGTTNVVVGARDKKVYIYNNTGVRATFPLKQFRSIGKP